MEDWTTIFPFLKTYGKLKEVLTDQGLAALGDAFINLTYSLALSAKKGQPSGVKVKGSILAKAIRKAGLREHMPSRISSHMMADAAEALIVYAWLQKYITLEECILTLCKAENSVEGFAELLSMIKSRLTF
ncbi:MAG: ribonuclease III family protein [Candidatus Bathyarchaeia archaeon]